MLRTYVFGPLHFINLRVGVYDAIKVDIRTLENIFPVQVWPEFQNNSRRIWKRKIFKQKFYR